MGTPTNTSHTGPSPSARLMFENWEREWKAALVYWREKCSAAQPAATGTSPSAGGGPRQGMAEKCTKNLELIERTLKRIERAKLTGTWTVDVLRLGISKSRSFLQVIGHVSRGEAITILDVPPAAKGWALVRGGNVTGWVSVSVIRPTVNTHASLWRSEDLREGHQGPEPTQNEVEIGGRG